MYAFCRRLSSALLLTFISTSINAQDINVKGRVIDENGEPIIGANILVKGTTNGTITDYDGNFTLEVSDKNPIIRIRYICYKDSEVTTSSQNLVIYLK